MDTNLRQGPTLVCKDCFATKPTTEFYKNRGIPMTACKSCQAIRRRRRLKDWPRTARQ